MSDLPRQKSNFPQNKEVQFSIHFCSILCIKYFLICKIKRYVINFFVYKNRFLARQIGPVMAFIPDNISVHDPIKKQNKDGCCQLGFSVSLIFHKNNTSVSAKIITGLSLSILSTEKVKTFSSCGAHFRSGDNIFFCSNCNDNSVHHSKDAFVFTISILIAGSLCTGAQLCKYR